MNNFKIIKLDPARWSEFRELRLESLREEPLAFGKTYEEEAVQNQDYWIYKLERSFLPNSPTVWFVVENNGELVGLGGIRFATSKKFKHIARFTGVYVKKQYRGLGVGKMIIESRFEEARKRGVEKIKIIVNEQQKDALEIDKKIGFHIVGTLKKEFFIDGKYYDGYLLEKLL